jgi:GH15 family glucan-1,4-alpha-glucosidase
MLVRTATCIDGEVEIELVCEPVFDYGSVPAEWKLADGGRHEATAVGAGQTLHLRAGISMGIEGNRMHGRHVLQPGEKVFCALWWDDQLTAPADADEADALIRETVRFWRSWLNRARIPDDRLRQAVQRSALTIKGLSYMPTGATVAALTTSLPETPGRGSATGTTAIPGCATRPLPCKLSTGWNSTGRRRNSCSSSPMSSRTRTVASRSCTASTGAGT